MMVVNAVFAVAITELTNLRRRVGAPGTMSTMCNWKSSSLVSTKAHQRKTNIQQQLLLFIVKNCGMCGGGGNVLHGGDQRRSLIGALY